jgi:hypothetical protein
MLVRTAARKKPERRVARRALGEFRRRLWHAAAAATGTTAAATPAAATTAAGTAAAATASTAAAAARTAAARTAATAARTAGAATRTATAARTAGSSSAHGAAGAVKRLLFRRAEGIECGDDNESQHDYQEGVFCGVLPRLLFPEALESGQHENTFDSIGGTAVQSNIKVNW